MQTRHYELVASEFDWKLSENKTIKAWGFNKSVPGPVLNANAGDLMVIRVKNELPQPTIVHWHGIRLPAGMDGTDMVQNPIQPGEEFIYSFIVPDAGTFWYHSHHDETVQMERGMYGAMIVKEEDHIIADEERVLVFDDMKLDKQNEFVKGNTIKRWMERHDGREGDTLLINGKERGVINMNAGQTERWRLVNASSARYIKLNVGGKPFRLIGTDGGLIEKPVDLTELLLVPGERADLLIGPFAEGENFAVESLPYNRMTFVKSKRVVFANVEVGEARPSKSFIPEKLRILNPLAESSATINRKVDFAVGASLKRGIDFLVNGNLHDHDDPVYTGELQVWEITNKSLMDHPFHLHGFFFQVIEENGKAPSYLAWKDVINLKPRSKVKIAWLPDNRTGSWMYHCHIIEHHAAGMMAHFDIVRRDKAIQVSQADTANIEMEIL